MYLSSQTLFLCLIGALLLGGYSCSLIPIKYLTTPLDEGYQLTLPDYLEQTEGLVDQATLQYGNPYKEMFLICHFQTWEDLNRRFPGQELEGFYDYHLENLLLSLQEPQAPGPDSIQIGEMFWALDGQLEGLYKGDNIHYRLVVVEVPEGLIQLLIWTPVLNLAEAKPDIDRIIQSIRKRTEESISPKDTIPDESGSTTVDSSNVSE